MISEKRSCSWAEGDPLMLRYHDEEWGRPVHDDRMLFEFLALESFQAGLSWLTILRKREAFREVFDGFDIAKVAAYTHGDQDRLMADARIVRNRAKIDATIGKAQRVLDIQAEQGSFDRYIWGFVGEHPAPRPASVMMETIPAKTLVSDAMSKELKQRGFKFVGSTICYAFMQAVGMVNDHVNGCRLAAGQYPGFASLPRCR